MVSLTLCCGPDSGFGPIADIANIDGGRRLKAPVPTRFSRHREKYLYLLPNLIRASAAKRPNQPIVGVVTMVDCDVALNVFQHWARDMAGGICQDEVIECCNRLVDSVVGW